MILEPVCLCPPVCTIILIPTSVGVGVGQPIRNGVSVGPGGLPIRDLVGDLNGEGVPLFPIVGAGNSDGISIQDAINLGIRAGGQIGDLLPEIQSIRDIEKGVNLAPVKNSLDDFVPTKNPFLEQWSKNQNAIRNSGTKNLGGIVRAGVRAL